MIDEGKLISNAAYSRSLVKQKILYSAVWWMAIAYSFACNVDEAVVITCHQYSAWSCMISLSRDVEIKQTRLIREHSLINFIKYK